MPLIRPLPCTIPSSLSMSSLLNPHHPTSINTGPPTSTTFLNHSHMSTSSLQADDITSLANACLAHLPICNTSSPVAVTNTDELIAVRRCLEKIVGLRTDQSLTPPGDKTEIKGAPRVATWKVKKIEGRMKVEDVEGEDELGMRNEYEEESEENEESEEGLEDNVQDDEEESQSEAGNNNPVFWKSDKTASASFSNFTNPILISTSKPIKNRKSRDNENNTASSVTGARISLESMAAQVTLTTPPKTLKAVTITPINVIGTNGDINMTTGTKDNEPPRTYFFKGSSYPLTLPPGLHVPEKSNWSSPCRAIFDEITAALSPKHIQTTSTPTRSLSNEKTSATCPTVAQIEAFKDKWKGGNPLEEMSAAMIAFRVVYEQVWATGVAPEEVIVALQLALGRRRHALMTRLRRANATFKKSRSKKAIEAAAVKEKVKKRK